MDRTQDLRRIAWLLFLTLCAVELAALTGIAPPPHHTIRTSFEDGEVFLSFSLLGSCLIHLWTRPGRRETAVTLVLGAALHAALVWMRGAPGQTTEMMLVTSGYGFGTVSLAALALGTVREGGAARMNRLATLLAAAILPVYITMVEFFLRLTYLQIHTNDRFLYAFDAALGTQISFLAGRMFMASEMLKLTSLMVYLALPLAVSLLVALQMNHVRRPPANVLVAFLTVGALGYVVYHLCPAIGPRYMLGRIFPMETPPPADDLSFLTNFETLRRNAMPSLHTAWVLLLWWNARPFALWVRGIAGGFVAFTLLGTLGLGEHYLVDLVVAVPFAVAVQAACTTALPWRTGPRATAVLGGTALTFVWLIALRYGIPVFRISPVIPWLAVLGTTATGVWLEWNLARAAHRVQRVSFESPILAAEAESA